MRKSIKEILHAKRAVTEEHIRQLEKAGKQGIRYTAVMPDIRFLVFGMLCDAGWTIHLIAGIVYCVYCSKNGVSHVADWLAFAALVGIVIGIGFTVYLNWIHEKEIATRFQKNMSFGLTVFSGLAGAVIALFQMASYSGTSVSLIGAAIGGILNFAAGLPIYLSFQKGITYGVQ